MLKKVWKETNGNYTMIFPFNNEPVKDPQKICSAIKQFITTKTGFEPVSVFPFAVQGKGEILGMEYFVIMRCADLQVILMTWNEERDFLILLDRMLEHLHQENADTLLRSSITEYEVADLDGEYPDNEVVKNF